MPIQIQYCLIQTPKTHLKALNGIKVYEAENGIEWKVDRGCSELTIKKVNAA